MQQHATHPDFSGDRRLRLGTCKGCFWPREGWHGEGSRGPIISTCWLRSTPTAKHPPQAFHLCPLSPPEKCRAHKKPSTQKSNNLVPRQHSSSAEAGTTPGGKHHRHDPREHQILVRFTLRERIKLHVLPKKTEYFQNVCFP